MDAPEARMVIVMRKDLRNKYGHKVHKGKLIAQGSHAAVGLITKLMIRQPIPYPDGKDIMYYFQYSPGRPVREWLENSFTKVVLAVDSEEELMHVYRKAQDEGLNTVLITDNGITEFSEPTVTCIGIGPDWNHRIEPITQDLSLF